MVLTRLLLTDFRSYPALAITPGPGFIVLTGENGAGKTNILEAVSLLAAGRGLRQATLGEIARDRGPGGFAVAARLATPLPLAGGAGGGHPADLDAVVGGERVPTPSPSRAREGSADIDIGTGTLATAPERRQVRINGAAASAAALGEWLAVLWLTPAMDRLFVEGASGRRRFLDRLVLAREPGHATHAARYEAAMRARNRLLGEEAGADPAWLAALEAGMAEHGAALAHARAHTVDALATRLADQAAGPFARAGVALAGWSPARDEPERALAAELRASRGRDAAAGRALAGPHRSDLAVTHLDKSQPAERCSTGEQKALLLGLVLAHADLVAEDRGLRPILLLDEIAAHLDPLRREALFARLAAAGGQVWMTGTERGLFGALDGATWLHVAGGTVGDGAQDPPLAGKVAGAA